MAKTAVCYYSDNAPAKSKQGGTLVIPGTQMYVLAAAAPYEGRLVRLSVKQTAGSAAGFKVDVYDSNAVYGPTSVGAIAGATATVLDPDLASVIAELTGTSGLAAIFRQDCGAGYRNADGDQSNPQRLLYIVIKPTGAAGSTSWDVSLTVVSEIG